VDIMVRQERNLHENESKQVVYSTLFVLLFLVVAGAVFTLISANTQADVVQKVLGALALALFPILIIVSSALWLFGKPADEMLTDTKS